MKQKTKCSVFLCSRDAKAKGLCMMHYNRLRRNGTLELKIRRTGIKAQSRSKDYHKLYAKLRGLKSIRAMHFKRFGGMRDLILRRDGYKCVMCGMTNEMHMAAWDRHLTINHKDHQGRYADYQNNDPDNMETLCLRCHGAVDAIQHGKYSVYLANLNRERGVNINL